MDPSLGLAPPDPASAVAPYEQLRTQIAARAASGGLAPGTRLPTVRALADDLGLAVNTVAKVYRALETDGVVVTEGRRGTFVASSAAASSSAAGTAAAAYVATCRRLGLTVSEATRLVEHGWARA
ncbi:GntR family transcriptional regulator [Nocardioides sp. LHG3406-4]|uniref:GntR family transcriptional regulator n=1 Tax=Nocardioides sp. LHG3406-4 TaxID=2804575 RepID=UPI003CF7B149